MRSIDHVKITSEGCSFHTIELKYTKLTFDQFVCLKKHLSKLCKMTGTRQYKLPEYANTTFFGCFSKYGCRVYLSELSGSSNQIYTVKLVINPRRLIEPNCDYLGIMLKDEAAFAKLKRKLSVLFNTINAPPMKPLPTDVNKWSLSRFDFCMNMLFDRKKLPQTMISLIRLGPVPEGYTKEIYTTPAQKGSDGTEYSEKHAVVFSSKRVSLVAYDKRYQLKSEKLGVPKKMQKFGILRLELQCKKEWIQHRSRKLNLGTTWEKIEYFATHSNEFLLEYAKKIYLSGTYYSKKRLLEEIDDISKCKNKTKKRMLKFVELIDEYGYVIAVQKMSKRLTEDQMRKLNDVFRKERICPMPLTKETKLRYLHTLPEFLSKMGNDILDTKLRTKEGYRLLDFRMCM